MILKPAPISSAMFSFKNNVFSTEVSELRNFSLGRVYDDACDRGFSIISAKTGNVAVFVETDHDYCGEDIDVVAFNFKCVTTGLKHLKAVIFND